MSPKHEIKVERVLNAEVINAPLGVSLDRYDDGDTLTIFTNKRGDQYREQDAYSLIEVPTIGGQRGRTFSVTKIVHAKNGQFSCVTAEPYTVHIDDNEQRHTCVCNAARYKGVCRHIDALRFVVRAGLLDSQEAQATTETFETSDDPFAGVPLTVAV